MQLNGLLYRTNEFWIAALAFAVLMVATEIGFRRGRAIAGNLGEASIKQLSGLQEAMIGLLALLLGFSFFMAQSRYDMRRGLVVDEADAIDIVMQRSRLLPEPNRSEVGKLLKQYVDVRLAYYNVGFNESAIQEEFSNTQYIQDELWLQASAVASKDPNPIVALFVSSLSDLNDLASRRDAERDNTVPETVYYLLFVVGLVAMALVGFGCGVGNRRHLPFTISVVFLICFVVLVITDFDRPRRGLITISQESMITLQQRMNSNNLQ